MPIQLVGNYTEALRYARLNQQVFKTIVEDAQIVRQAATTVGLPEEAAVRAIRNVGREHTIRGTLGMLSRHQLRTAILEEMIRSDRFMDIADQTWTKLLMHGGA